MVGKWYRVVLVEGILAKLFNLLIVLNLLTFLSVKSLFFFLCLYLYKTMIDWLAKPMSPLIGLSSSTS